MVTYIIRMKKNAKNAIERYMVFNTYLQKA